MVFQSLALFPHRTVGENIEFSLKIRGVDPATRKARRSQLMASAAPAGGLLRQERAPNARAASASAWRWPARSPSIPRSCSSTSRSRRIDYKLRKTLEKELKDIHRETGKTFVYITHSLEEAMVMSDRIGVMRAGKLVQVGTPQEIYSSPELQVRLGVHRRRERACRSRRLASGQLQAGTIRRTSSSPPRRRTARARRAIWWCGRNCCASSASRATPRTALDGRLYNEYALGSRIQYQVRVGEQVFVVEKLRQQAFAGKLDDEVLIGWDATDSHPGDRRHDGGRQRRVGTIGQARRSARLIPLRCSFLLGRLRGAAAGGDRLQLHAAAHLRAVAAPSARELRRRSSSRRATSRSCGRSASPALTVADPGAHLLSRRLWPGAGVRPMVDAADAAVHHSALRVGERAPLWLGAVLHQERRAARHAQILLRGRAGKHGCSRTGVDRAWAWSMSICPSCCSR